MRRLLPVLAMLLFSPGVWSGVPVWDLEFPQHQRWDVVLSDRLGREYRIEWTRGQETLEDWSELVTYSFTPAAPEYFPMLVNRMFAAIGDGCPGFESSKIEEADRRKVYVWSDDGCGETQPHKGVTRFEYVGGGILILQYTQRPKKSRAPFPYWREAVINAEPER